MKKNKENVISQVKSHTKVITGLIISCGVGQIMGNIMKDYKPDAKGWQKIAIKLGAAALTGMIVKEVCKFANNEVDELFDAAEDISVKIAKGISDNTKSDDSDLNKRGENSGEC